MIPAFSRAFEDIIVSVSQGEIFPSDTETAVPTIILTILYKKPSAVILRDTIPSFSRTKHSLTVLTVSVTVLPDEEKA